MSDLIVRKKHVPAEQEHPITSLRREMNRLMDSFFQPALSGSSLAPEWATQFSPHIEVKETDKEVVVTAELPGMTENDIEVLLTNDSLTLRGEKKEGSMGSGLYF